MGMPSQQNGNWHSKEASTKTETRTRWCNVGRCVKRCSRTTYGRPCGYLSTIGYYREQIITKQVRGQQTTCSSDCWDVPDSIYCQAYRHQWLTGCCTITLRTHQAQHTKANSSMRHRQHTAPDKPARSSNRSSRASPASRQANDCGIWGERAFTCTGNMCDSSKHRSSARKLHS